MSRKFTKVRYIKTNIGTRNNRTTCYLKFGISLDKLPFGNLLETLDGFNSIIKDFNIETYELSNEFGDVWHEDFIVGESLGYAYRNSDDNDDPVIGERIAMTRAQQAAYERVTKLYDDIQNLFINYANKYDELAENTLVAMISCKEHINDIVK